MELAAMMGDQFIDETIPKPEKPKKPVADAEWHPTKERNWMDDLTDCAKSTAIYGGLSLLVWYWEISGLMDISVALPSMLVCFGLAGVGIGKALGRKCR
jgi:hypothetical protein